MEKHITLLGILHIVYSALGLLAGVLIFTIFSGIGYVVSQSGELPHAGDFDVVGFLWGLGSIIASMLILFAIPGIIGGIGLLKRKEWARILTLIVGFFDLLHIPFGTILGVYTIWALFNNETIKLFRPHMPIPPSAAPAP